MFGWFKSRERRERRERSKEEIIENWVAGINSWYVYPSDDIWVVLQRFDPKSSEPSKSNSSKSSKSSKPSNCKSSKSNSSKPNEPSKCRKLSSKIFGNKFFRCLKFTSLKLSEPIEFKRFRGLSRMERIEECVRALNRFVEPDDGFKVVIKQFRPKSHKQPIRLPTDQTYDFIDWACEAFVNWSMFYKRHIINERRMIDLRSQIVV